MTFRFLPLRFEFEAVEPIQFGDLPANEWRGSLGWLSRAHPMHGEVFSPRRSGPSGLRESPRPFVIQSRELARCEFWAGDRFSLEVVLFDTRSLVVEFFRCHLAALEQAGLGRKRSRIRLLSMRGEMKECSLLPEPAGAVTVHFVSPTDLKGWTAAGAPPFALLMARLRDRVSNLRALYGVGPLAIEFNHFCDEAAQVTIEAESVRKTCTARQSSRTGQTQIIRGLQGWVQYQGPLEAYVPYLRLARWTGVGRHAVWGNGELRVEVTD